MTNTDPMGVSRFDVDPKRLRALLRDYPNFSTVAAMAKLELNEPKASKLLLDLAEARWILYAGKVGPYDHWEVGRLGNQYSLKDFLKRTTVPKAEALLAKAIDAAREFNQSDASTRIAQLKLFGSLARGGDENGTVGDIDLEIVIESRQDLDEAELKALQAEEKDLAPESINSPWIRELWANHAGARHLRKVGKRLTVSPAENIKDLGCEYQVVYQYDCATQAEAPCDRTLIPADAKRQASASAPDQHEYSLPPLQAFRPWPEAPANWSEPASQGGRSVDRADAQYLWQRGFELDEIARRQKVSPDKVQAALAAISAADVQFPDLIYAESPVDALAPFLSDYPDVLAHIRFGTFSAGATANVHLHKGELHTMCSASTNNLKTKGSPELHHLAEALARAGAIWVKRFKSKMPKIQPNIGFYLQGYQRKGAPEASTMKSASAFGKAMNAYFDETFESLPFEKCPHTHELDRSLFMTADLTAFSLSVERNEVESDCPLGPLHEVALDLNYSLVGPHEDKISHLNFQRHLSESKELLGLAAHLSPQNFA